MTNNKTYKSIEIYSQGLTAGTMSESAERELDRMFLFSISAQKTMSSGRSCSRMTIRIAQLTSLGEQKRSSLRKQSPASPTLERRYLARRESPTPCDRNSHLPSGRQSGVWRLSSIRQQKAMKTTFVANRGLKSHTSMGFSTSRKRSSMRTTMTRRIVTNSQNITHTSYCQTEYTSSTQNKCTHLTKIVGLSIGQNEQLWVNHLGILSGPIIFCKNVLFQLYTIDVERYHIGWYLSHIFQEEELS